MQIYPKVPRMLSHHQQHTHFGLCSLDAGVGANADAGHRVERFRRPPTAAEFEILCAEAVGRRSQKHVAQGDSSGPIDTDDLFEKDPFLWAGYKKLTQRKLWVSWIAGGYCYQDLG